MKNYSKAYHWDEQMKSIMNLNAAMYYNLLLFTGPFSYVNAIFFEMCGQWEIQGVAEFFVMSSYCSSFTAHPSCWGRAR